MPNVAALCRRLTALLLRVVYRGGGSRTRKSTTTHTRVQSFQATLFELIMHC